MRQPPERRLQQREIVLLNHWLDHTKSIESGVLEVTRPIVLCRFGVASIAEAATVVWEQIFGLVFAAEEAAGDGVVDLLIY